MLNVMTVTHVTQRCNVECYDRHRCNVECYDCYTEV